MVWTLFPGWILSQYLNLYYICHMLKVCCGYSSFVLVPKSTNLILGCYLAIGIPCIKRKECCTLHVGTDVVMLEVALYPNYVHAYPNHMHQLLIISMCIYSHRLACMQKFNMNWKLFGYIESCTGTNGFRCSPSKEVET